jgi:general secretion pathway protein J
MPRRDVQMGFTLVELLVALFAISLLAVMSWRGLDGMIRAQAQTETRSEEMLTLQVGLAQWGADLDALVQLPNATAIEWNGRVLRMTRRATSAPAEGVLVVAWTRRMVEGTGTWLRWQSPQLTTRGELEQAWLQADVWSHSPGDEQRAREVTVVPLEDWQIFFFRGDAWTHPLSSAAMSPAPASTRGAAAMSAEVAVIPDGVRLVLNLPAGGAVAGVLTRDWVRPTLAGGRS